MALTNDQKLHMRAGSLKGIVNNIMTSTRSLPIRMTQVSVNFAAIAVRTRAKQAGIKLGRFALTEKEVAEIAKLPFRWRRAPLAKALSHD
jgi:hypothetical protein